MAKINSTARDILMNMVERKAAPLIDAAQNKVEAEKAKVEAKRKEVARVAVSEIKAVVDGAVKEIAAIAKRHNVLIVHQYTNGHASLDDILSDDRLRSDAEEFIRLRDSQTNSLRLAERERDAVRERVNNAKERLFLKVALNSDYDSVLEYVNNLKF